MIYQIIFIYLIFDCNGQRLKVWRSYNKSENEVASDYFTVYNLEQQISHYYHINHKIILFWSLTKIQMSRMMHHNISISDNFSAAFM